MKAKRILCILLVLCMLLPLLPAGTVFADKEERGKWQYRIYLHTSSTKNAEANVTQSGKPVPAIKATLSFTADGEERSQSEMITNTKKKQYSETFKNGDSDGWVTMDYAPWSFKNLKLENLYTDCYRFYSVELQARYIQDVNYPNYEKFGSDKITMFKKYPGGENKKESGGWEIKKGSDANFDYRSNAYGNTRTVTSTGNFANLGGEIHISVNRKDSKDQNYASNGTTQEVNWDGTIADGYSAAFNATGYNALAETNAPKLTFGYVLGTANGKSILVDDLGYYGVAITEKGYSYNPEKLFKAMGEKGVGRFSCMLRLYVDGGLANSTLVTFVRDTFEVDTPVLTNYNYLYTQGTDYIVN